MREPLWISKESALAMHERQLAEHGGLSGTRDMALLESALARPQNLFFYAEKPVTMSHLAASYAYGLASNHPFIDGNKRTALTVSQTFLALNGYAFTGDYGDEYKIFISLAAGTLSEEDLAAWFEKNTRQK